MVSAGVALAVVPKRADRSGPPKPMRAVSGVWVERTTRGAMSRALRILVAGAGCYVTAEAGLGLGLLRGGLSPTWLSTGVGLAALLTMGFWTWPGIAAAAFVVGLSRGWTPGLAVVVAAGDTVAPMCAYLLLRLVRFHCELDRLRDAFALVFLGGFAGVLVGAAIGDLALVAVGAIGPAAGPRAWTAWWSSDSTGVLVVVPFLLFARYSRPPRMSPPRWAEAAALVAGTALVTWFVTWTTLDLLFLVFPFLIWAALRFEHAGAAPCVLVTALIATVAAAHGAGPFADNTISERMVILQAFNGAVALTGFLLAAVTAERNAARRQVERAAADLTRMAEDLEHGQMTLKGMVLDLVHRQQLRARDRPPPA